MGSEEESSDINDLISGAFPGTVLVNYIVIAETLTDDNRDLSISTSETMTPWLAAGMLKCATDMILSQQYDSLHDEEKDDD